jgi:acyl carrier protein
MSVKDRVLEVIRGQFPWHEDMSLETHLEKDMGADSLDRVELMIEIEEEFDLHMPDMEAAKMQTVKDIIDYVEEKIRNPSYSSAE